MSNARSNSAAEINLEEFERRLRAAAGPQGGVEDPLAELTRLVDTIGFERTPSERALEATRPLKIAAKPAPAPPPAPPPPPEILPPIEARLESSPPFEPAAAPLLRPSFREVEETSAYTPPPSDEEVVEPVMAPPQPSEPPPRGRNWGLKVAGLIAASVVMIAAVAVFKVGRVSHSGAPPLILASTAPTKVAPPSEETVRTANESGSLLTRDTAQPTPTPPKLVAPPEAPVDLSARPQPTATPTPTATAEAEASPVAPASNTPIVAKPLAAATPDSPVSSDPSRVKTISVRPDGTLISSGFEANTAAATPSPAPTPTPAPTAPAAVDAEAATPALALPTKLSPPKSAARVMSKSDTTAPADEGAGPVPVKAKKPKPTPTPDAAVAEAEPKTDDAAPAEAAGGGYSVQLAAPNNRADADELVKKAQARYADAIGGATVGVRKADRHGNAIYRVRVLGLSRAQASAMCAKIKATGGDCFTAKN